MELIQKTFGIVGIPQSHNMFNSVESVYTLGLKYSLEPYWDDNFIFQPGET